VLDEAHKERRHYVFSVLAAQGCAELLVTEVCMIWVPHVCSVRPPWRLEL
jgi:hypothetical protein